jgi:hypothetical protein
MTTNLNTYGAFLSLIERKKPQKTQRKFALRIYRELTRFRWDNDDFALIEYNLFSGNFLRSLSDAERADLMTTTHAVVASGAMTDPILTHLNDSGVLVADEYWEIP